MSKQRLSLLHIALLSLTLIVSTSTAPVLAQTTTEAQRTTEDATYLNVELVGLGKQLQFQQAARLTDVLKQAEKQNLVLQYPLAITLYDSSEQARVKSAALKSSVLNQMTRHQLGEHPLYQYIQTHQFAPRLLSAIDVDDVRLDKFNNPLLRGDLSLFSPIREEKVIYLGNIDNVYTVKDQAGISLQQQTKNLIGIIGEPLHPPVLVYPDGNVVQPRQGLWLTSQYYLPPLTIVYIPFEHYESSKMDQDIVRLLTQLKPTMMKTYL